MAKQKNYGGHTTEQMAREVDELVAKYEEAEALLAEARESVKAAEQRVDEAREALDRATLAFVEKLPSSVRQSVQRSYSQRIVSETPRLVPTKAALVARGLLRDEPADAVAPSNGAGETDDGTHDDRAIPS